MAVPVPPASELLSRYPEFSKASLSLVNAKLGEAARRTSAFIYTPEQQTDAVCLKAAVLLTKSPEARAMRLVDDAQAFSWADELYQLQRSASMGKRVFGVVLASSYALQALSHLWL